MPTLKEVITAQKRRARILFRAFGPGNFEERFRLAQAVCRRLPAPAETRQRLLTWCLNYALDRKKRSFLSGIKAAQQAWDNKGRARLRRLLDQDEHLEVPAAAQPKVSFILVLHNKAHLSLLSIESVLARANVGCELILVDNGSTDQSGAMLDHIEGAQIIRNETNLGFGPACMQGAERARGEYLCFFNNDALLKQNAIQAALANFRDPTVGAVGGKILLASGALQEAGSMIWSDGSALGYGRADNPDAPQYNFRRPVDYCSGVFLLTPRRLFAELGGFLAEFAPAYYEDTDYCMTLWQRGYRVIYEPLAVINHYESASSGGNEFATALMAQHQKTFYSKWQKTLAHHYEPKPENICAARIAVGTKGLRILYVDDRIPHRSLGSGFPRSNDILSSLVAEGHHVTCVAISFPFFGDERSDIPQEVELFDGLRDREAVIGERIPCSDLVWVSRPHNLDVLLKAGLAVSPERRFRLIYDAEAIFAERGQLESQVKGSRGTVVSGPVVEDEFALAKCADAVVVVGERDRRAMVQAGVRSVHIVGHRIPVAPTSTAFAERSTFLFIGAVHGRGDPNADSVRYFCSEIWASVEKTTGATLVIAGYGTDEYLGDLGSPSVRVLGPQPDLQPLYESARVFVVPTRFAAGLPFKAHEAAARGVPLVVSGVIACQLGWRDGVDFLVAPDAVTFAEQCRRLYSDESLWNSLRANSLQRAAEELGPEAFACSVRSVLNQATGRAEDAGQGDFN